MRDSAVREADGRFLRLWAALLGGAVALATVRPQYEGDLFWHRTLGRAVLQHHRRVVPEPTALASFTDPAVVPEWLWGVVTDGLSRAAPRAGPAALVAILGALSALALVRLLRRAAPELGPGAVAAVSGLAMAVALQRLRVRPEAASIALVPALALAGYHYAEAAGLARLRVAAAALALEVLWAQLHGSFVLAPALFAIGAGPALLRDLRAPARTTHLGVLGALLLGLLTSAHGVAVLGYVLAHAGGDATRHIGDMRAPTWDAFAPSGWLDGAYGGPYGACLVFLWLAALAGLAAARRVPGRELLLALLGVALMLVATRFLVFAALLAAPLAALGLGALGPLAGARAAWPGWRWLGVAAGLAAPALWVKDVEAQRGPVGRPGLAAGAFPEGAAAFLETLPSGSPVLTSFDAGAPLGFWLGGRVRTYVDSRTPLHFDDADFALARDVFRDPEALRRALLRFEARAVVLNRSRPVCGRLPAGWAPVVMEAEYTTYAPGAAPPVALSPCGPEPFTEAACEGGGATLDAEIARLARPAGAPFARLLRAARILRCGGPLAEVPALLPAAAESGISRPERDYLEAVYRMRTGAVPRALELLDEGLRAGDARALALVTPAILDGQVPADRARALLTDAVTALDDAAPPDLRALLALACAQQEDAACVRVQALRAAVRGSRMALPALMWLTQHHGSAGARAEAEAWIRLLQQEAPPARP
jgi:hypothetical protein